MPVSRHVINQRNISIMQVFQLGSSCAIGLGGVGGNGRLRIVGYVARVDLPNMQVILEDAEEMCLGCGRTTQLGSLLITLREDIEIIEINNPEPTSQA